MSNMKRAAVVAASVLMLGSAPVLGAATPDAWITTKSKLALYTTEGVSGTAISVDTVDGRVTLHGTVGSEQEKAKAEQTVKQIAGVASVRNLLAVVAPSKQEAAAMADDQIEKNVEAAFDRDAMLDESDIEVSSVNAGTVVLKGKADTLSERLRAIEVASAVPGVRRVASEMTGPDDLTDAEIWSSAGAPGDKTAGDNPKGTSMNDAWITSAAKVRLIANPNTPALDINIDTRDGAVTLFGIVPSEDAKRAAAAEVGKVSGVKTVANELRVVPESKQDQVEAKDEEIKDRVTKRLEAAPLDDDDIKVEVSAGAVRLSGTVGSQAERLRALTVARGAAGVRSVVDDLHIDAEHASR